MKDRVKCNLRPKNLRFTMIWSMFIIIKLLTCTNLTALNTDKEWVEYTFFDTDELSFAMDNCANVNICNYKEAFTTLEPIQIPAAIATASEKAILQGVGTINLIWRDDDGKKHEKLVKDFYYCPQSLFNVLSIPKLAQQIEDSKEKYPTGTGISTYAYHSVFTWEQGKYTRTIIHPSSLLPSMGFNTGFAELHNFCTSVGEASCETLAALATDGSSSFVKCLKDAILGLHQTKAEEVYMKEHERLNHPSHKSMMILAKQGKISKCILEIDKAPICPSCMFRASHRRPWRRKKDYNHIRKEGDGPGEAASIDQLVMSQPGIIPQAVGKLMNRRFTGSQICTDHFSGTKHVVHLEDFSVDSTVQAKLEYERFVHDRGRKVLRYRAHNRRYSDADFMKSIKDENQTIEFCGVGAHHQNGIAE